MAKLYDLVGNYKILLESADSDTGENFLAVLETLSDAIDTKIETCAKVVKNLTSDVDMLKAEEARLAQRRKSIEGNVERLKKYMRECMDTAEKQKIKTPLFTVYIVKGKPKIKISNEELIPDEYRVDPPPPAPIDKKKLLLALQNKTEVAGAKLTTSDPSLNIR